jgi:Glyoxalase-like domain
VAVELDHLFVLVSQGAPEADFVAELGLIEGSPNEHAGQGTACRRFFFSNAYLELLWVDRPDEARADPARPLRLWERWSGRDDDACPFGVVLRPAGNGGQSTPFPAWEYRPSYLPPNMALHVGGSAELIEEPLLVFLSQRRRPDSYPARQRQPVEHPACFRALTALRVFGPWSSIPSGVMQAAEDSGVVSFRQDSQYFAEISFDNERYRRRTDLRPTLPLVLCW